MSRYFSVYFPVSFPVYFPIALGLLAGCWILTFIKQLPSLGLLSGIIFLILTAYCLIVSFSLKYKFKKYFCLVIHWLFIFLFCMGLGLSWATYVSYQRLAWVLPAAPNRELIEVKGVVQGLPIRKGKQISFELVLSEPSRPIIRLFWAQATHALSPGDQLTVTARLTLPHMMANPGSFDTEKQSFLRGVRASGQVKSIVEYRPLSSSSFSSFSSFSYSFSAFRYHLFEKLKTSLEKAPFKGIMIALIVGDKSEITPEQWRVLQRTGTSHLVAISGLHVSLIAGSVFFLSAGLWRRGYKAYARLHCIPAQKIGALGAILSALGYAALAGWSVPTQRALVMVVVAMAGCVFQRRFSPWFLYCVALILVLLLDPLAPLSAGFWLSFLAVGSLLFSFSGWVYLKQNKFEKWAQPQWVVFVGLLPLGFLFFQQTTLIGPLANFIAIPFASLLVVPIDLLGALFLPIWPTVGTFFLKLAHLFWSGLWIYLEALANFSYSMIWKGYFTTGSMVLACLGCVLLLMPKGLPGRGLGVIAWLPLLLGKAPAPMGEQELWFSLLEVGQGLSAVIQTKNHVLVYDTGPRFGAHSDAGAKVIVPFLKSQGIDHIDTVVISHSDLDHRGGLQSLLLAYAPGKTMTPDPLKVPETRAEPCQVGQHWTWDGVDFDMLSPRISEANEQVSKQFLKTNNQSCVLKISTGSNSILLTGDIEAVVEKQLLTFVPEQLKARILVVPHHGSKGSSTQAFVQQVSPEYALFPVGYNNFFGFPKAEVVARYRAMGAKTESNAVQGMIQFRLDDQTQDLKPLFWRASVNKFWQTRPS